MQDLGLFELVASSENVTVGEPWALGPGRDLLGGPGHGLATLSPPLGAQAGVRQEQCPSGTAQGSGPLRGRQSSLNQPGPCRGCAHCHQERAQMSEGSELGTWEDVSSPGAGPKQSSR